MIKVDILKRDGFIYRFKIISHGDPIVCAGVSALSITCINFLQSQLKVKNHLKFEHEGGFIEFAVIDPRHEPTALILNHMLFGLEQIKETHPKQIRIRITSE